MTWHMWACDCEPGKDGSGRLRHIGPRRYVELHMLPYPIVPVQTTQDPAGDYWGWLATGAEAPTMIWPSQVQFEMCFPYGSKVEVERGKGEVVRLSVRRVE